MTGNLERLLDGLRDPEDADDLDAVARTWTAVTGSPEWVGLPRELRLSAYDDAAALYAERYRRSGSAEELERSIAIYESAVAECRPGEADHPYLLGMLANRIRDRYELHGAAADLPRVVALSQQALDLTPARAPQRAQRLNNLGGAFRLRYAVTGEVSDLDRAVAAFRDAAHDEAKPAFGNNLAVALSDRYDRTGQVQDLDAALEARRAVATTRPDDPDRVSYLANLGVYLSDRYDRTGALDDLEAAVHILREATSAADGSSTDGQRSASNLGMLLLDRYQRSGDPADLDASVAVTEATVAAAAGSPELPGYLNNLGNAYQTRFDAALAAAGQAGPDTMLEVNDLSRAVEAYRRAANLACADSAYRPKFLTNLGSALIDRAAYLPGRGSDLDDAVTVLQEAVDHTPDGSPDRSGRLNNLASALSARSRTVGGPSDARRAIEAYRTAAQSGLEGNLELAVAAGRNWGAWASARRAWPEAAEAYDCVLQAMDQLYRTQLRDMHKRTWLRAANGIPAEAAHARLALGDLRGAATVLERGRALLVAEVLERERADLRTLHERAPWLAARFVDTVERLRGAQRADADDHEKGLRP